MFFKVFTTLRVLLYALLRLYEMYCCGLSAIASAKK